MWLFCAGVLLVRRQKRIKHTLTFNSSRIESKIQAVYTVCTSCYHFIPSIPQRSQSVCTSLICVKITEKCWVNTSYYTLSNVMSSQYYNSTLVLRQGMSIQDDSRAPKKENEAKVALQLCPPLQFGPLTYQPIEYVFVSSNQSALRSCLRHLTSQLGEGCIGIMLCTKTWNDLKPPKTT